VVQEHPLDNLCASGTPLPIKLSKHNQIGDAFAAPRHSRHHLLTRAHLHRAGPRPAVRLSRTTRGTCVCTVVCWVNATGAM
jgi:hypothetical protein